MPRLPGEEEDGDMEPQVPWDMSAKPAKPWRQSSSAGVSGENAPSKNACGETPPTSASSVAVGGGPKRSRSARRSGVNRSWVSCRLATVLCMAANVRESSLSSGGGSGAACAPSSRNCGSCGCGCGSCGASGNGSSVCGASVPQRAAMSRERASKVASMRALASLISAAPRCNSCTASFTSGEPLLGVTGAMAGGSAPKPNAIAGQPIASSAAGETNAVGIHAWAAHAGTCNIGEGLSVCEAADWRVGDSGFGASTGAPSSSSG
mmetsp:Transcript_81250/g.227772  ORF Transcript_81250/g.227772 Transcript_81250/m.227772 type:complete len:264 (+) Transcript_81250:1275-2066(+)